MLKTQIYWILLLSLLGLASCGDDDNIGFVEKFDLQQFDFPQGDNPWDKEIEQIAKDWGMYIIYKDVDSTHLNKMWTSPIYYDPIYVCKTPSDEDVQVYLELVKTWLLGSLDKNKDSDRKQLPFYLYLVNDLNDGNPRSQTYGKKHIQFKKDGLDYWSLSFTGEELEAGLTSEIIHNVACSFSYPGLKVRFSSGEYEIPDEFAVMSDYESRIGIRYYSLEQFKIDNPWAPDSYYTEDVMVHPNEKDPENAFQRRGFAPEIGEDFKPVTVVGWSKTYGAPTWMPWSVKIIETPYGSFEDDRNPGPVAETVKERVLQDFMNMVRLAMTYPETQIREDFPLDAEDPLEQAGNQIINDKYDLVVKYMKDTYNVDLPKYADILDGE